MKYKVLYNVGIALLCLFFLSVAGMIGYKVKDYYSAKELEVAKSRMVDLETELRVKVEELAAKVEVHHSDASFTFLENKLASVEKQLERAKEIDALRKQAVNLLAQAASTPEQSVYDEAVKKFRDIDNKLATFAVSAPASDPREDSGESSSEVPPTSEASPASAPPAEEAPTT